MKILIHFHHNLTGAVGFHSNYNSRGMKRIPYRRTLGKEFRIGSNLNPHILLQGISEPFFQLIIRTDRNCGFDYNHTVSLYTPGDLIHYLVYIAQVCGTILFFRSSHPYKNHFRILISRLIICGKSKSLHIFMHQIFQPGLINGRNSLPHSLNFLRIHVNTGHLMSGIRQGNTCHQSYISCSCYCNFHYLHLPALRAKSPLFFTRIPMYKSMDSNLCDIFIH